MQSTNLTPASAMRSSASRERSEDGELLGIGAAVVTICCDIAITIRLLNEFAFKHETAFRGSRGNQMKGSGSLELLQLAGPAHDLPYAVVQKLRLAVGNEDRLDHPFDVRFVSASFGELSIAARFAADARNNVVGPVLIHRRARERALTFGLAFSMDELKKVLAAISKVESKGLFLLDERIKLDSFRPFQSRRAGNQHANQHGNQCEFSCIRFHFLTPVYFRRSA